MVGVVETRAFKGAVRVQPGSGLPQAEEARGTRDERASGTQLVEERARQVTFSE